MNNTVTTPIAHRHISESNCFEKAKAGRQKKLLKTVKLRSMFDRSTEGIEATPCYVVRLACVGAFVLPIVFALTFLMAAMFDCYRCLKNVEVSGKMTHNIIYVFHPIQQPNIK